MGGYTIVLADGDDEFLAILEMRLQERYGGKIHIQTYSELEQYNLYFGQPRAIDMLIVNEAWYNADLERHTIHTLIRLTETPATGDEPTDTGLVLYKYAGMKEIFAELNAHMANRLEESEAGKCRMICVYSACGGVGTTTVALGVASALSHAQKTVLYMNLETLQSTPLLLKGEEAPLDGAFASAMLAQDETLLDRAKKECGNRGFDFLPLFDHSAATYGLTLKHFQLLAERIRDSNRYQYIVLDCSPELTQEKSMLISKCDHTLVVTQQYLSSCEKTKALLRDINVHARDKFYFICNKFRPDRRNYLKDTLLGSVSIQEYIPLYQDESWPSLEDLKSSESFAKIAGWLM